MTTAVQAAAVLNVARLHADDQHMSAAAAVGQLRASLADTRPPQWLYRLARWRWWIIAVASLGSVPAGYAGWGGDFWVVYQAARALVGLPSPGVGTHGPLGIFVASPSTQMGPASFVAVGPVAALSEPMARLLMTLAMALVLPLVVWLLERAARMSWPQWRSAADLPIVVLLAGLFCIPQWHQVAVSYAHVDDVLVFAAAAWALKALAGRQPVQLGLALALAVDAKPWSIALAPLVLALPSARDRLKAAAAGSAGIVVAWAPFLIAPGALTALATFRIRVDINSPLTLAGIHVLSPMPLWVRPAQLGLGLLLAYIAVRRHRPSAVLMVVVAARIALDPAAFPYYFVGLVVGCAAWELVGTARRFPWLTALVGFVIYDVRWLLNSPAAVARLDALSLVLAIAVVAWPARAPRSPEPLEMVGADPATRLADSA